MKANDEKVKLLTIRVTEEEHAEVMKKAKKDGKPVQRYVRGKLSLPEEIGVVQHIYPDRRNGK